MAFICETAPHGVSEVSAHPAAAGQDQGDQPVSRHRGDFWILWTGQTVSYLGSSFTYLAIPLIAATTLGSTATEMGLLAAESTAPALLLSLPAGEIVDRLRRRNLMIAGDVGRALLLLSVPLAWALGALSMGHLYAVAFVTGALGILFDLSSRSLLPELVKPTRLAEANARLELSGPITGVVGPGLAGAVVQAFAAPVAIALDSVSYALSALCSALIRHQCQPHVVMSALCKVEMSSSQ